MELEKRREWDVRYMYSDKDCEVEEQKRKEIVEYFSFMNSNEAGDIVTKVEPVRYKQIKCTSKLDTLEYLFKYGEQLFYEKNMKF
jgi:hypothetical protein